VLTGRKFTVDGACGTWMEPCSWLKCIMTANQKWIKKTIGTCGCCRLELHTY